MYGRGGYPRGSHHDPRYNNYNYSQHQQAPYGRDYTQQYSPYTSQHGTPTGQYPHQQHSPYYGYPNASAQSPYYPTHPQSTYPTQSHAYPQAHQAPPNHQTPQASRPSQMPTSQTSRAIPATAPVRKTSAHFANLSWTPNKAGEPSPAPRPEETRSDQVSAATSIDDDDNPFRPPRDMRAEDEIEKKVASKVAPPPKAAKPDVPSFSIKGFANSKADDMPTKPKPVEPRKPVMVKELILKKRLKARPQLSTEHARSDSIYYRKTGNESVVGSGTYGKVYKAVHVYTKNEVALKKIRMEGERDGFPVTAIREIKLLQSINHANIVALQEVMVEHNDCFMVFEYLQHDLTGLLNHPTFTLTDAHKKDLARQMFDGLDYLHRRGVLHRDIKAANILVSKSGQLKFADFGLARFFQKTKKQDHTNRVITIWYRPPELLLGETQYGAAVDIWSAACVLVEIFTRHAIFPGDGSEINQLDKIYSILGTPTRATWPGIVELQWYELLRSTNRVHGTFAEKYRSRLTTAAFELLEAMFQYDPEKRPSAADILEHPYFATEQPAPKQAIELAEVDGEWHEFESKALRKEKDREERKRREKERENQKESRGAATATASAAASAAVGEKRHAEANGNGGSDGDERESKRARVSTATAVPDEANMPGGTTTV